MGHFVHYNIVGAFWGGGKGHGRSYDLDEFMGELRARAADEGIQECIHHGARYEDCTMFTVLGNGGKFGRPMDKAFLKQFAAPGEKWDNVQWVEVLMYSEFSNLDKPQIVAGGNWQDYPNNRPGVEEHDWSKGWS